MVLNNATETLKISTSSTSRVDVFIIYNTVESIFPISVNKILTSIATHELISNSLNSTIIILSIFILNAGGASNNIQVIKNISGTNYNLSPLVTRTAGQHFQYTQNNGWSI